MENKFKISLLIPVYNTENFLKECLDSVLAQSLQEIEIICVNDGSSDKSKYILEEYRQKDSRIKIITLEKNEGLARARYHAINAATGDYIMFLDSDDYLEPNACEIAYKAITKHQVDILHFSTNIIPFGLVDKKELQDKQSFVDAYCKKLSGENIFDACYIQRKYCWNVWNKIYRSDIVKKITPFIPNVRCIMSEDMFIYSMISYFAKSYHGIKNKLYNYRFGSGVSTSESTTKIFDSYARNSVAIDNMISFHKELGIYSGNRRRFIEDFYEEYRNVLVWHFMYTVKESDAPRCFDVISKLIPIEDIVERLLILNDLYQASKRLYGANFFKTENRKIKNIALFYYKYSGSGVERVMSKLIPMFESMGYKLTLIIEKDDENSFELNESCKKVIIPSSISVNNKEYMKHAKEFKKVLIENNIDLVLYQASNSPFMLYDLLMAKSLGIYFACTTHDFITSPLLYRGFHFSWKPQVLKLTDLVQTITNVEKEAYIQSNINATYIPNPLTFTLPKLTKERKSGKELLWVGRIDGLQKNPLDMIYILFEIKRFIPDVHLTMLGNTSSKKEEREFKKYILNNNLNKNITWIPHAKNMEEYYRKADMLIMTSTYEVYPMVLSEALSYGLPVIAYDMPYVEMVRNNPSVISVQPNNIKQTAQEIMNLITNEEKRNNLGLLALEYINESSKIDISSLWKEAFINLEANQRTHTTNEDLAIFFEIMYRHYNYPKDGVLFKKKTLLITNLFRYFKKFGFKQTIKKIKIYIKRYGFKAAIRKGRIRI